LDYIPFHFPVTERNQYPPARFQLLAIPGRNGILKRLVQGIANQVQDYLGILRFFYWFIHIDKTPLSSYIMI
jgi:hypothetical protein